MIVTVTANPSLDRTLHIDRLHRGEVHRANTATVEPSGKGVNVSLALHVAEVASTAVVPVAAGPTGQLLTQLLAEAGLLISPVPVGGGTRVNTTLAEADGTTTKINERGTTLTPAQVQAIIDAALRSGGAGDWLAWCGSLPPGFDDARLAEALSSARAAGFRVALDVSGPTLAHIARGVSAGLPHLIKPNTAELAELVESPLRTVGEVADAAAAVMHRGIDTVLVSMGADGALLVDANDVLHGQARAPRVVNTAGAGDALLAGYLAAEVAGGNAAERLAGALRFGASAVAQASTALRHLDEHLTVRCAPPERERMLGEPA